MSTTTPAQSSPHPTSEPSSTVSEPSSSTAIRVVDGLVGAGLVASDRAEEARVVVSRVLGERPTANRGGSRSRLAEIAGYAGGALVIAAVALAVASEWSNLTETAQLVALGVLTVVLGVAGGIAATVSGGYAELRAGRDDARRRLTSALLTGAAVAGATTVARGVEMGSEEFTSWPGFLGGLTTVLLGATAYRLAPSALAQLAVGAGAVIALTSGLDLLDDGSGGVLVASLAFLALAVGWLALAELGVWRERVFARFAGVGLALFAAQLPVFDEAWSGYVLTVLVVVAGFVLYLRTVSWPYLVAGVLGITLVVPEAVTDWTDGSLGVAGGVLVAGLTLLAASLAGLRVRREAAD